MLRFKKQIKKDDQDVAVVYNTEFGIYTGLPCEPDGSFDATAQPIHLDDEDCLGLDDSPEMDPNDDVEEIY